MTDRYALSDKLHAIANDLHVAGFQAWPAELSQIASAVRDFENRAGVQEAPGPRISELERELAVARQRCAALEVLVAEKSEALSNFY